MNTANECFKGISLPSKFMISSPAFMEFWMVRSCCATTESTSMSMRLNSSKHPHAPHWLKPAKNLPMNL